MRDIEHILSEEKSKGKLGFRLYAPWYKVDSENVKKSQEWQVKYFYDKKILIR